MKIVSLALNMLMLRQEGVFAMIVFNGMVHNAKCVQNCVELVESTVFVMIVNQLLLISMVCASARIEGFLLIKVVKFVRKL
jgi:hypothetical protein